MQEKSVGRDGDGAFGDEQRYWATVFDAHCKRLTRLVVRRLGGIEVSDHEAAIVTRLRANAFDAPAPSVLP